MSVVAMLRPDCGFTRSEFQEAVERHGIDSRTVWTGNAARQPMMKNVTFRAPADGMPHADLVMTGGMILPMSHALDDEAVGYVCEQLTDFLASH